MTPKDELASEGRSPREAMLPSRPVTVANLAEAGVLEPVDVHLARWLGSLDAAPTPELLLAIALVGRNTRQGHVCVDLTQLDRLALVASDGRPLQGALPAAEHLLQSLHGSRLVVQEAALLEGAAPRPLVLGTTGRLYLHRYWDHERVLAGLLRSRARLVDEAPPKAAMVDGITALFGPAPAPDAPPDWQRVAAQLATVMGLTVISGGPGTGKTTTVVRLLALLLLAAEASGKAPPRVLLMAPTGKAAARLVESIRGVRERLPVAPSIRDQIPTEAITIHRALGVIPDAGLRFVHHQENPLAADFVLVDEASMVDVALMRRLLEAVPAWARVVFLGDRHQLASVEAGAVLADVCAGAEPPRYSPAVASRVEAIFGEGLPDVDASLPSNGAFGDTIVQLRKSHRFADDRGIGQLATAIRGGKASAALAQLRSEGVPEVQLIGRRQEPSLGPLKKAVLAGYRPFLDAREPAAALKAFDAFRVLCAHRRGVSGVELVGPLIEQALEAAGLIRRDGPWYHGRPLLITRNDHRLRLYNGDIGILWGHGDDAVACFPVTTTTDDPRPAGDDGIRRIAPARLPPHETVFAMSVHKSQGSEFDAVALVLPDERSPLLTRELVYTAVTRARSRVTVFGNEAALAAAIERPVERLSGLRRVLWDEPPGVA